MDLTENPPHKALWIGGTEVPEVGPFDGPAFWLPIPYGLEPYVTSALAALTDRELWSGSDQEYRVLETAINTLITSRKQGIFMEDARLAAQVIEGNLRYRLYRDGDELPPVALWANAGTVIGPEGPQGEPGQVQAGFWLLEARDNGDGTATMFRQWWCRTDPHNNAYQPDGEWIELNTITGPVGPEGPIGPEGPEGPQGLRGYQGDHYLITADNPPGAPDVVYFYRQLTRTEGAPLGPLHDPQHFGGAIAAQGAQGPAGPAGPQGPAGPAGPVGPAGPAGTAGTNVTNPYTPEYDEFQRLGTFARRLVEDMSDFLIEWVLPGTIAFDILMGAISRLTGFPVLGESGAVVWELVQPLQEPATRRAATNELYCRLIPYRDLSDASITAFWQQYGGDMKADFLNQEPVEAVITAIANNANANKQKVRDRMSEIIASGEVDPTFDYSTLPCTPNLGNAQTVFDFTVNAQGWQEYNIGGIVIGADYIPGQGWLGKNVESWRTSAIRYQWSEPVTITHIEVLCTDVAFRGATWNGLRIYPNGIQGDGFNWLLRSWDGGAVYTYVWDGTTTVNALVVGLFELVANSPALIRRVSLTYQQ